MKNGPCAVTFDPCGPGRSRRSLANQTSVVKKIQESAKYMKNSKVLNTCDSLEPNVFLSPFLDVIRSEVVTGPVTGLALDAVHKMLAYELLHPGMKDIASAVENLADAVTHAR